MKTLEKLFMCIAVTGLFFSCSKYDQPDSEISGLSGTNSVSNAIMQEVTYIVMPNGTDDTETMKNAFSEAVNHGPGAVVQLMEGEYHINFIEICDFSGTFRGAGKGKTVITTVEDLDVDALIGLNLNTILIRFVRGNVHLCDMTIKTPPGPLSSGTETWIDGLVGFSAYTIQTYLVKSGDEYINAVINNVDFIGHWDNCGHGLKAEFGCRTGVKVLGGWLLSNTNITITNCLFDDFLYSGALIWHIKDGKIKVGTINNGNVFNNILGSHTDSSVGYGSLGVWMNINVEISIIDNTFNNPDGAWFAINLWRAPYLVFLESVPQIKTTICNIERNIFNITGGEGGILMNDRRRNFYPEEEPMHVQVKNNLFNMSNDAHSGIECYRTSGTIIRNNIFTGSGYRGIWMCTGTIANDKGHFCENGLMLGNNFSKTLFSIAAVQLNSRSRNWTIVGGSLRESIIDNGFNNIITGMNVNTSDVSLGQTIVDNFELRRELMDNLDDQ